MGQSAIGFQAGGQNVDGVIAFPTGGERPYPGVLVCHPHPMFGGNMHNAVVVAICSALATRGIASLRFNFRAPAGDPNNQERLNDVALRDAAAAFDVLTHWDAIDRRMVAVAGYSFGAAVIARGADRFKAARAFALVSPPLASVRDSGIGAEPRSRLFVVGSSDRLVNPGELAAAVDGMDGDRLFETVDGADHSLAMYEAAVAEKVAEFLEAHLWR